MKSRGGFGMDEKAVLRASKVLIKAGFIPVSWVHRHDLCIHNVGLTKRQASSLAYDDFYEIAGDMHNNLIDDNWWNCLKEALERWKERKVV